jgi:exopolyphosphatase/guanosine-5'-triphosphate,3'-diphosphate pyrophosphatase
LKKLKKAAVIDLGTNTFNLLITEGEKSIYTEKVAVKLGQGGISKGVITSEAFDRAIEAMKSFKAKADEWGVEKMAAIGTSALRNASNATELIKKIREVTGIEVKVISGDEEAELIYKGVRRAIEIGNTVSLVMDIGGGSVEFIICNGSGIFWKRSFEIGGQRLLDRFHNHDPITSEESKALLFFLNEELKPLAEKVEELQPELLIGSSGTFDTLAEIDILKKGLNISYNKEYELSGADFNVLYTEIIAKDRAERMKIPGMIEMRVDMVVVACLLIKFVLDEFNLKKIAISAYALKEGVE